MLIFALFGALASYSDAFLSINKAGIRLAAQSENNSYTGEAEEDDIEALVRRHGKRDPPWRAPVFSLFFFFRVPYFSTRRGCPRVVNIFLCTY